MLIRHRCAADCESTVRSRDGYATAGRRAGFRGQPGSDAFYERLVHVLLNESKWSKKTRIDEERVRALDTIVFPLEQV